MTHTAEDIEIEALSLPEEEKTRLILNLLDSLEKRRRSDPQQVEQAWIAEAQRRYEAYLNGEERAIPADEVFSAL